MLKPAVLKDIEHLVRAGLWDADQVFHSLVLSHPEALGIPVEEGYLRVELAPADSLQRVRDAIAGELERLDAALATQPTPTDNERLEAAFDRLEEEGIATLENAGMTDEVGRSAMWRRVVALEDVGVPPSGFCYFHEQDVTSAVEGSGLWLRYGASPVEDDPTVDAQNVEAVGRRIVRALESCGLAPQWSGSHTDAIRLPSFEWRRRFTPSRSVRSLRDASVMALKPLIESVKVEIRAGLDLSDVDFGERFRDYFHPADLGRDLSAQHDAFVEAVEAFIGEEQQAESAWTAPTDNDRLSAALASLSESGVITDAHVASTIDDGWGYVGTVTRPEHHGAVFFHRHDVIWCLRGEGLHLAFGAWQDGQIDPQRSVELADRLCAALRSFGLEPVWSGSYAQRVHLPAFRWQRRRWTTSPPLVPQPPRQGLLGRLFGRRRRGVDFSPDLATATRSGVVEQHLAHRDAGAFDLALASRMREKGDALGIRGAHAASFGAPLCFTRAGETTWFMPRAGSENLPTSLVARNHRGVEAAGGRSDPEV